MTDDFYGCLPFTGGQRFVLHNGTTSEPGVVDYYRHVAEGAPEAKGGHQKAAADLIQFRSVTKANAALMGQFQVTYYLKRSAISYALMRRVTRPVPGESPAQDWTEAVRFDADGDGVKESSLQDEVVCSDVVSFNVEYMASNGKFSNLEPSPCPWGDPLGDGAGANDTTTPYRIPSVRIMLTVLDGGAERVVFRGFEILMG